MARRRRPGPDLANQDRPRPTVTAHVRLPIDTDLPRRIPWQPPRQRSLWDRAIRVSLRGPRLDIPTRLQRVEVVLPRHVNRREIKPSVVMVDEKNITTAPRRRTRKLLNTEENRLRRDEKKFRRAKRYLFGQLDSLNEDTYGLVRNAVDRRASPGTIATAALITRAINGRVRRRRRRARRR